MQNCFCTEHIVTYPECDINNRLRISGIMRHVQQIGGAHLDSLGLTYGRMAAVGIVLLLAKEGLSIRRLPEGGERIRIETTPRKPKGGALLRDCTIYAEDGEELVFAETTWVAADTETHRIVRPGELKYEIIPSLEEREYAVTGMRVREPQNTCTVGERIIRFSDIDCNHHLNNAVYADIVYDFLPFDVASNYTPRTFFVHFQHEGALGETLTIRRGRDKTKERPAYIFSGQKADGSTCFMAYIEF